MSSYYDDPFAEFASFGNPAPAPQPSIAPAPPAAEEEPKEKKPIMNSAMNSNNSVQQQPMMMNQQTPFMQQQNPFGGMSSYNPTPMNGMASQYGMMNYQPIVPASQTQQQSSPWSLQNPAQQQPMGMSMPNQQMGMQQQQQQQQQQPSAPLSYSSSASFNGYAPTAAPPATSPVPPPSSVPQQAFTNNSMGSSMVPSSTTSPHQYPVSYPESMASPGMKSVGPDSVVGGVGAGSVSSPGDFFGQAPAVPSVYSPAPSMTNQQPAPVPAPAATMSPPVPPQPIVTVPSAIIQEDDDFFGDFSNSVQEKSPSRPPSVFEANENDDVSYLSKSTGGTERVPGMNKASPLDDPKFAPKPAAVHGLENAKSLSQHAPPGASPLPDFDKVTHSGYVLSRISFRTILIKKWKQTFWVSYGNHQVLFFRSSADFEDWVSNPYLSQAQRDFLVKLKVDFLEDLYKQGVRGYQCTNQRLKNYNNQMLHQFKLERWMDYGPTIAAAFASPNEREVFNLRTILVETAKRSQAGRVRESRNPASTHYAAAYSGRPATAHAGFANLPDPMSYSNSGAYGPSSPNRHFSSSASTGRLDYGHDGSVYSQNSHKSYGVMSAGPVERTRGAGSHSVSGYNAQAYVGRNGRY